MTADARFRDTLCVADDLACFTGYHCILSRFAFVSQPRLTHEREKRRGEHDLMAGREELRHMTPIHANLMDCAIN
jgi:hypothetical protein